jgi:hypothetical protein
MLAGQARDTSAPIEPVDAGKPLLQYVVHGQL